MKPAHHNSKVGGNVRNAALFILPNKSAVIMCGSATVVSIFPTSNSKAVPNPLAFSIAMLLTRSAKGASLFVWSHALLKDGPFQINRLENN